MNNLVSISRLTRDNGNTNLAAQNIWQLYDEVHLHSTHLQTGWCRALMYRWCSLPSCCDRHGHRWCYLSRGRDHGFLWRLTRGVRRQCRRTRLFCRVCLCGIGGWASAGTYYNRRVCVRMFRAAGSCCAAVIICRLWVGRRQHGVLGFHAALTKVLITILDGSILRAVITARVTYALFLPPGKKWHS